MVFERISNCFKVVQNLLTTANNLVSLNEQTMETDSTDGGNPRVREAAEKQEEVSREIHEGQISAEDTSTGISEQHYTELHSSTPGVATEMTELYEYEMNMSGATTLDSEYEEYEEDPGGVASVGSRKSRIQSDSDLSRMREVDEEYVSETLPEEELSVAGAESVHAVYEEEGEIIEIDETDEPEQVQVQDPSVITIQSGVSNIAFASEPSAEYYDVNDDDGSQIQLVEELVVDGDDETNIDADLNDLDSVVTGEDIYEEDHPRVRKSESSTKKKRYMMGVNDESELMDEIKSIGSNNVDLEDLESNSSEPFLEISTRRRLSQEGREGNCYCGKDRNFNIAELLCASCNRWYHESCIGYQLGKLVPFMMNYVFVCKNCSPNGLESFKRNQAQFIQMCITALANLIQMDVKEGRNRRMFSCEKDIIPFFDMHWDAMNTMTRRVTQSWHSTVVKAFQKDGGKHFLLEEIEDDPDSPYYGLKALDITQIRPNYDAMIRAGHLKLAESQNSSAASRRGSKRRVGGGDIIGVSQASLAKRIKGDIFLPKLATGHGYPSDHPFNKDGFRYLLAEPDSNAPFRQEFDENSDWTGRIIPGWLYRVLNPWNVFLALHDRAPQLKVSEDRFSVTGEKGYCMIRATHGVSFGSWYWEAKVVEMPEGSATRIGWGQPNANLQGPLGVDQFGYSYRSRYGTRFFEAKGKHYGHSYGLGDVIGCLIILPERAAQGKHLKGQILPPSHKEKPLVRFKSHLYYEEKDVNHEAELKSIHEDSKVIFFKNGVCQGVAFENIFDGIYYPAISLYKSITVSVNFGPTFDHFPQEYPCRGICERAEEATIYQTVSDLVFLTENDGKLCLEN